MSLRTLVAAALVAAGFASTAFAAGTVSLSSGAASIVSDQGVARPAAEKSRVKEGETLVTGSDGEIHVTTDDHGLLAVRPSSRVKIEVYIADGSDRDRAEVSLLKGFMRSVTGWIGKVAPRNYKVKAGTATIGIRGTDHEVGLVEGGDEAGAYAKVNEGEVVLRNPAGEVPVPAGQAAVASFARPAPPRRLDAIPPIFQPGRNDPAFDRLKDKLAAERDEALARRREAVRRGGGTDERGLSRVNEACTTSPTPLDEILAIVKAYEEGNASLLESRLDPAMIGLQRFRDGIAEDLARQKQVRILVKDVQMQCGNDLVTLQFLWEKRFLDAVTYGPGLLTGRAQMLMHRGRGGWRLGAITGESPFGTASGALGELTFGPAFALATIGASPVAVPVTLQVVDADLAGLGLVNVQVVSSAGDAEVLALPEVTPGRFSRGSLVVAAGAAAPGNGVVEVGNGVTLTLRYVDTRPGNNRPATTLTASIAPTGTISVDTTPDPFSFPPVTQAVPGSTVVSAPATISGINAPAPVTVANGAYSVAGGAFTASPGTVSPGQVVRVRAVAAASAGASMTAVLTVGGVSAPFLVTTATGGVDTTPDAFAFAPASNVPPSTPVGSAPVVITGINAAAPVSIAGGSYSVAGGAFTTAPGTISSGQSVIVQVLSAAAPGGTASATLTVGGVSATFVATTAAGAVDTVPDRFGFATVPNAPFSSAVQSGPVVITGINAPTPVSATGGLVAVNGGPFVGGGVTVQNGEAIVAQVVTSSLGATPSTVTVTVGGVSATFTAVTAAGDTTPDPFSFGRTTNVQPSTVVSSGVATITGINVPTAVTAGGGATFSIAGGPFTAGPASIANGQTLQLRVTSSAQNDGLGSVTGTVTVGTVSASWFVGTGDSLPNAFGFATVLGSSTGVPNCTLASSAYTTAPATISGISIPTTASITSSAATPNPANAQISVNGGPFSSGPLAMNNGDTIAVRFNSVGVIQTTPVTRATVSVGGVSASVTQICR